MRVRKKLFNFRLPSALALSLVTGVLFGVLLCFFNAEAVYVLFPFLTACVPFAVCVLKCRSAEAAVCFVLVIAFFLIGALYSYFLLCSYRSDDVPLGQVSYITGKVAKVGATSSGKTYLVISGAEADGVKLKGKILAYLGDNAGDYCERGYEVSFNAELVRQSLFSDGVSYGVQNGIKYYCNVNEGLSCDWGFSLFGVINGAMRRALFNNTDGETAAVCFAMLTGDSSSISQGTLASFRSGGIAHLFAVSGLHIGIIFGALTALLKKLPVNRYVSAFIRIGTVLFYSGVCSFTASSVRASVMCSVAVVASLLYKKNDGLNALSLSAIIILLINPMQLFSAGFLLSFGAALGLMTLSRNLSRTISFLPEKPRSALSCCAAAQLSTIPTQLYGFGYVSWAGLFLNVILLPVVSVFYLLLFLCTVLSVIMPFAAAYLIEFAATPIQLLINLVVACGFERAVITKSVGLWIYVPFALFAAGICDKLNLKLFVRGALCCVSALWILLVCVGV